MLEHTYLEHTNCEKVSCPICDGGLALCTVCGGAEGELTLECPGRRTTREERERVFNGTLNYRDGKWVEGSVTIDPDGFGVWFQV